MFRTFDEKRTYPGFVALIVRIFSCKLFEHRVCLFCVRQFPVLNLLRLLCNVEIAIHATFWHHNFLLLSEIPEKKIEISNIYVVLTDKKKTTIIQRLLYYRPEVAPTSPWVSAIG
jgi:hypothetical protein